MTGHVRGYLCGRPMIRSSEKVYGRDIPMLAYHDYGRVFWITPTPVLSSPGTLSLTQVGRDRMRHPTTRRDFWQHTKNESVRWTDPLAARRWWSRRSDGEGEPFWLNGFTRETVTEEPLNANWSVTLRNSGSCDDDGSILGGISHPIANGCYPLYGGGQFDLGTGSDPDSFRYKRSFT